MQPAPFTHGVFISMTEPEAIYLLATALEGEEHGN